MGEGNGTACGHGRTRCACHTFGPEMNAGSQCHRHRPSSCCRNTLRSDCSCSAACFRAVIAASSGLWTLLFSSLRLRERIGPVKLISTVLTFGGVMLVVLASGDTEYRPLHHGHHAHAGSISRRFQRRLH